MLLAMLIGGAIGFAFGRFPGFVTGAIIAALLVQWAKFKIYQRLRSVQSEFSTSVFAVMGALCKADGVVSQNEIQMAEALFEKFRLSADQREEAKAAFNRGKQEGFDLDGELAKFLRISGGQPALRQMFLQVQVAAVSADGQVHPAEHEMLVLVARGLGLPEAQVEQLEAMLRGAHAGASGQSTQSQLDDAYKVMGVSEDITDAELKRTYRKLMSENHPDKLAGRGLPESMRAMAEDKTQEITHAYDLIKSARGKAA